MTNKSGDFKKLNIDKNDKVGMVIAHPDDEVLMFRFLEYLC